MELGVSGQKSNDLFLVGFKRYLNSIGDVKVLNMQENIR